MDFPNYHSSKSYQITHFYPYIGYRLDGLLLTVKQGLCTIFFSLSNRCCTVWMTFYEWCEVRKITMCISVSLAQIPRMKQNPKGALHSLVRSLCAVVFLQQQITIFMNKRDISERKKRKQYERESRYPHARIGDLFWSYWQLCCARYRIFWTPGKLPLLLKWQGFHDS